MLGWALLADAVPLYPLYALLFADSGLSGAQISALFAIWSAVGLVAEVPSGALADRFGRRAALVAAGVLQAVGYALWIGAARTFAGFAAGFVLWGLGGSLVSGAREALLYDGLAAVGAEACYARVNGWVHGRRAGGAAARGGRRDRAVRARRLRAGRLGQRRGLPGRGRARRAAARSRRRPPGTDARDEPGYLAHAAGRARRGGGPAGCAGRGAGRRPGRRRSTRWRSTSR